VKAGTLIHNNREVKMVDNAFKTFEDLECWKACRELRNFVALVSKALPKGEEYRLKDQMLRAARSTTANIAEGYGRFHYQESIQFCRHSRGSLYEVLDHFIAGYDENLMKECQLKQCRALVERGVMLLNGYIRFLGKKKSEDRILE